MHLMRLRAGCAGRQDCVPAECGAGSWRSAMPPRDFICTLCASARWRRPRWVCNMRTATLQHKLTCVHVSVHNLDYNGLTAHSAPCKVLETLAGLMQQQQQHGTGWSADCAVHLPSLLFNAGTSTNPKHYWCAVCASLCGWVALPCECMCRLFLANITLGSAKLSFQASCFCGVLYASAALACQPFSLQLAVFVHQTRKGAPTSI